MTVDNVRVEALGVRTQGAMHFEDWTSLEIHNSLTEPSEASFELGDDTGYSRLSELTGLGAQFRLFVNDRPCITGRVELNDSASDASRSSTQSFVIRTRLTDAVVASAPQGLRLKNASIKQFVLACYEAVGLAEANFDFRGDVSRDLMTGKSSRGKRSPVPLEPLKDEQAKVTPAESVFEAVDRHLRRHGMLHWDGPDGRIIVAAPDDQQDPIGNLWMYQGRAEGQFNNLLSLRRTQDVTAAPTILGVFGIGSKLDFSKTKVGAIRKNADLIARGFQRGVVVTDEAVRTKAIAEKRATREFAERNRALDRLTATLDGLAYLEGAQTFPWSVDTVADVVATHLGGAIGPYYIEDVRRTRNAEDGDRSTLTLVKQGVWVL